MSMSGEFSDHLAPVRPRAIGNVITALNRTLHLINGNDEIDEMIILPTEKYIKLRL